MKRALLAILILPFCMSLQNCTENEVTQPEDSPEKNPSSSAELVKSVTFDVGVTHKLEFTYNSDLTLDKVTSGSSNLPWKYTSVFKYDNGRLKESVFESQSPTKYSYQQNRITQKSQFSDNLETTRYLYTYNSQGQIKERKIMIAFEGVLSVRSICTYTYGANDELTETRTDAFDESGSQTGTIVRKIEGFSKELIVNPFSLLHPLYQHQATELFDDVVLMNTNKLPLKISESGNAEVGPVTYEYVYDVTGKRIDKVRLKIKIGDSEPYYTAGAVFHY
ncbi:hypothetical protein [Desertivirga xinjiangensis]|uniref:hypothetical protein n=1 Tax=Desertivirga xinjiangensis TaxID=539206 RepID=UPI00210D48AF|nr:hypothetical protein [Pedobacter xinjiangensis]